MNKLLLLILSFTVFFILSCRKDTFITGKDAAVRFSSDTLFFDTVFTSSGSITETVKIINNNNQKLRLSDVKLMGGAGSYFSIMTPVWSGPGRPALKSEETDG